MVGQVNGVNRFMVSYSGAVGANFMGNVVNFNNAQITLGTTGSVISRNIADANPALIVQQRSSTSTGDILDLKNSASTLMVVKSSGKVGIGTTSPAASLTVAGNIQSTAGGFTFPDNTVQTTAAVSGGGGGGGPTSVSHDTNLTGSGTEASPLGVAVPLDLTGGLTSPIVTLSGADGGSQQTGGKTLELLAGSGFGGGQGLYVAGGQGTGAQPYAVGGIAMEAHGGGGVGAGGDGLLVYGGNASDAAGSRAAVSLRGPASILSEPPAMRACSWETSQWVGISLNRADPSRSITRSTRQTNIFLTRLWNRRT